MIIWGGATWHGAKSGQAAGAKLGFTPSSLSAYKPDLISIQNLGRWMQEAVKRNHCHQSMHHLFDAYRAFIRRFNALPYQVVTRLWPQFELDPKYE